MDKDLIANLGSALEDFGRAEAVARGGRTNDGSFYSNIIERRRQRAKDEAESTRQKAIDDYLNAKRGREMSAFKEEDDPESALSKELQSVVQMYAPDKDVTGMPASKLKDIVPYYEKKYIVNTTNKAKVEAQRAESAKEERRRDFELEKLEKASGLRMREAEAKAKVDAAKNAQNEGKQLAAGTAVSLGELGTAIDQLNEVKEAWQKSASGTGSGLKSMFRGTEANEYEDLRDVAAQTIGGILEGGKLTNEDYERYKSMLPSPWDTESKALGKVENIRNLINLRKEGSIKALGATGYNIEGMRKRENAPPPVKVYKPGEIPEAD